MSTSSLKLNLSGVKTTTFKEPERDQEGEDTRPRRRHEAATASTSAFASPTAPPSTPRPGAGFKNEKDRADAAQLVPALAALIKLPFLTVNLYASYTVNASVFEYLFHIVHAVACASLFAFISRKLQGEFMIIAMGTLGCLNEYFSIGMNSKSREVVNVLADSTLWIIFAVTLGCISGVFCKAKDIYDGRFRNDYAFTERLFLVVPYIIGVWVGVILGQGMQGFLLVFFSIFFCLSLVGWGLLIIKILRSYGLLDGGDLLSIFRKIANASFVKVLGTGAVASFLFLYMFLPAMMTVATNMPHTLVLSIAIVFEVAIFDLVN